MKTGLASFSASFALTMAVFTVGPVPLPGATITVTSDADGGAGTLRAALASANNGDTINFALPTPAKITLTSGELLVAKTLNISGPGPADLAVDGNALSRVFHILASNAVTISSIAITNGRATNDLGGGIFNQNASLILTNCALSSNSAPGFGSGGCILNLANAGETSSVTVVSSRLIGNSAGNAGGAIHNWALGVASVQIINSVVSSNSSGGGGGILNESGSSSYGYTGTGIVAVVNSALAGNSACVGGGLWNLCDIGFGSVRVVGCTLAGNLATCRGGGISSEAGGGPALLAITNSTLSGNSAQNYDGFSTSGGGIEVNSQTGYPGDATLTVINCTLNGNWIFGAPGSYGNGIYNGGQATIGSTILSNISFNIVDGQLPPRVISLGYNISSDSSFGALTNATDQLNADPKLGPLKDNGGPTFTHALLPRSPAIDKGRNLSGSATDQRGFARTLDIAGIPSAAGGDGTDVGAVESTIAWLSNPSVISNQFGLNLIGPASNPVVVEASADFAAWTPLATNAMTDPSPRFTDPAASNFPQRFYRARSQP